MFRPRRRRPDVRTARRLPALALLLVVAMSGCGYGSQRNGPDAVLDAASESLASRRSGRIDFQLEASTPDAGPIGFGVKGPYSFEGASGLARLDLEYQRILGDRRLITRIVSTGAKAWTVVDGEATVLPASKLGALRLGTGQRPSAGLPDLDLTEWVEAPRVATSGSDTTIKGRANAARILRELHRLSSSGGDAAFPALDPKQAERLARSVRESSVSVATNGDRHVLRSLDAVLHFEAAVPKELQESLGDYAGATIEVTLDVADLPTDFKVDAPA